MHFFDEDSVIAATPWDRLIDALAGTLRRGTTTSPDRHVHDLAQPDGSTGALLLMPSWANRDSTGLDAVGVKVVTYYPANAGTAVPTVNAAYVLFDGADGKPLATIDGDTLTARRTAAVSALAARHLARPDARSLVVVGTGQLAPNLAMAHASGRDLESITIWGRNAASAQRVAGRLRELGYPAAPSGDLQASVASADIVSCATGATEPVVQGRWLRPGTHLDLVGSFRPDMRESDDEAIRRSTIFVDTVAGATVSGDLAQPMATGLLTESEITADLADLASGRHPGRSADNEITLFKSAGFAAADLAAARLVASGGVQS
ncbi:MAG: ornithine cyclodeaminase family protein [Acidimicrobiia bacterium]|nr:ornithine cyclodeaminase family protein [Acidimicrobiia bacterium]